MCGWAIILSATASQLFFAKKKKALISKKRRLEPIHSKIPPHNIQTCMFTFFMVHNNPKTCLLALQKVFQQLFLPSFLAEDVIELEVEFVQNISRCHCRTSLLSQITP